MNKITLAGAMTALGLIFASSESFACTSPQTFGTGNGGATLNFNVQSDSGTNCIGAFWPVIPSGAALGTTTANAIIGMNVSDNKFSLLTGGDAQSNPTIPDVYAFLYGFNGSTNDQLRSDINKYLFVDIGATTDTRPTVQNISAVDASSTTTAGQNGINQITGTPSAQSAAAQAIQGQASSMVQITGSGNGTIVFEGANDGSGTTWFPIRAHQRGSDNYMFSITGAALNGTYEIPTAGLSNVRVRATAWTSGASAPKWSFGQAAGDVQVLNVGAWTPLRASAISTTVVAIKSTTGQLGVAQCYNPNTLQVYLQVFNLPSGSVTLGSTSPTLSIPIAPTNTGGFALAFPGGFQFNGGMSAAVTTTATGSTAPSTAADCNFGFN